MPGKSTKKLGNKRPRAKRLAASDRKQQIIESAIALFGKDRLKGTTTKALADAAGVSEGTIFKHFPTKKALYLAAFEGRTGVGMEHLVTGLHQLADEGRDEEIIQQVLSAILHGYDRDRDLHRMLLYVHLGQSDEENKVLDETLRKNQVMEFLIEYVATRQQQGVFRPGNPGTLAHAVIALGIQVATSRKLFGNRDYGVSDDDVILDLTRLLLNGLRQSS